MCSYSCTYGAPVWCYKCIRPFLLSPYSQYRPQVNNDSRGWYHAELNVLHVRRKGAENMTRI